MIDWAGIRQLLGLTTDLLVRFPAMVLTGKVRRLHVRLRADNSGPRVR